MTSTKIGTVLNDLGSNGAVTVTPKVGRGGYVRVTCTASTLTVAAPIIDTRIDLLDVPALGNVEVGDIIIIEVRNTSGGALTVTWNAAFKGAPANPATGQRRIHTFIWDGANWVLSNSGADVPN